MNGTKPRPEIIANYKRATYCYATPVGLLLLGFFSAYLVPISIVAALLLGVTGMVFTKRGFALASASGDREKKDVGYGNFILGGIVILLGLLGFATCYFVTG